MDNYPIETQARTDSRRSLHVMNKTSHSHELPDDHSGTRYRVLFGVVVIALFVSCVIGLVVRSRRTNLIQQQPPQQEHINTLADQLSSLKQTDLIVFPDGRVWYVRAIHGKNMEIVGWVGDNVRSENIDLFVLREDNFTIVRHNDPNWPTQRDRFLEQ